MNKNTTQTKRLLKGASIALLGGLLISCAAMEADKAKDREQLLAAAGFKMKLADTPDKLAHLKTLQQHKIVIHAKDGKNYYVYADATTCQCMYVGLEANYQSFQQLRTQQKIVEQEQMTAEMNQDAAMNWGMWGYGMGGYGVGGYGMGGFY